MEHGTETGSTGPESPPVDAETNPLLATPPPAALGQGGSAGVTSSDSGGGGAGGGTANKRSARVKKDPDGFSERFLAQYGLSVVQDPRTTLTSIRVLECRFCRVFGRESAPGRIRAVSRKVHQWKGPFKTHNFTVHLTVCHAEKWQLYKSLESDEAREKFFFGVDDTHLLAIANAAVAAADSRDRVAADEQDSGLAMIGNNGLPALNSNTKDAHQSAKRLKFESAATTAAVSTQTAGSPPFKLERPAYPVRTIRFQRGARTLDLMHEVRNNPNETMQMLVRQAKQNDLLNVFDATRNHGKNRGRNHPPKHLFFTIDGVGSFSEAVFLRTSVHGIFSLSTDNPLVVELEYRVMEESSSEEDNGGEEEEDVVDNDYEEQLAAAAAAVGTIRQAAISPQQQLPQHPQQQQQPQFLLPQQLPQQQPRYSAYPHQYTRTGFWMH